MGSKAGEAETARLVDEKGVVGDVAMWGREGIDGGGEIGGDCEKDWFGEGICAGDEAAGAEFGEESYGEGRGADDEDVEEFGEGLGGVGEICFSPEGGFVNEEILLGRGGEGLTF